MDSPNSQLQLYADLLTKILQEDPCKLERAKSIQRDVETIQSRTRAEGFGFLTKSLPALGKALDQALEVGHLTVPRGFPLYKDESRPAFMQAYFRYLFNPDGSLREPTETSGMVVNHLRQVLFLCYKLELPYLASQEEAVVDRFLSNEEDLCELELGGSKTIEVSSHLTEMIFKDFNPKEIIPRHGPGAVATGERLEEKWVFKRLYSPLDACFPYRDYFIVGGAEEINDRLDWYDSLERLDEGCSKAVFVPKDSRGPRFISCEPLEFQWLQQGLGRKIMAHLETSRYTRGHINFTNQEVNRQLALRSSSDRKWATLDLKDASDRVSVELVRKVFERTPELLQALLATRTSSTRLPNGRVVRLNKFAPMGSALCFPVEAYCFWALLVSDLVSNGAMPLEVAARHVYVFGDDIIVPTVHATRAMQVLEEAGLTVNRSKSCIQGYFRESCGMDAYKGVCVTPLRAKTLWSGKVSDAKAYASYLELANHLREKGYEGAFWFLAGEIAAVYGCVPFSTAPLPNQALKASSVLEATLLNLKMKLRIRWNSAKSVFEVLGRRIESRKRLTNLDDWPRLLRNMVAPPVDDPDSVVLPYSTRTKYGWIPMHY